MLVIRLLNLIESRVNAAGEVKMSYDKIISAITDAKIIPVDKNGKVWKSVSISDDFRRIAEALGTEQLCDICSAQALKKVSGFTIRL